MTNTQPQVALTSVVSRKSIIISQPLDDDIVMANIERGHYYGIKNTGKRIWELVESPRSVKELCDILCQEYMVDRTICEQDILAFIDELIHEGLIEYKEPETNG